MGKLEKSEDDVANGRVRDAFESLDEIGAEYDGVIEAADVERREAEIHLLAELFRGEKSIEDNGLISADEIRKDLNSASW